jgi:hypothetical protein
MNQPALAASAPAPFLRRAFDWWIAQVKHALPPTIFFFVGFNLILWTKRLILEEHGVEFGGFFTATLAALLVGKAVLVTDNLPFMRRFDGAPLIQPILFKSTIYWLCVFMVRLAEGLVPFPRRGRRDRRFPHPPSRALLVAALLVDTALVDGAVPCLRHDTRAQYAHRRRRTLSPILPMELVRGQAYPSSAHSPAHAAQPPDRGEPDRGLQRTRLARAY